MFVALKTTIGFDLAYDAPPGHPPSDVVDVVVDMKIAHSMPVNARKSSATFFICASLNPMLKQTPLLTSSTKQFSTNSDIFGCQTMSGLFPNMN
jgi:hypothetical protein